MLIHYLQGYTSNRNRTLHHLYSNKIDNTAFLAGDSHANWVSDLVWLDETPYNQTTGVGAVGVEFAGTAVSSSGYGAGRSIANSSDRSAALVRDNRELQWAEGYYRGYYELYVSPEELTARYYGKILHSVLLHYDANISQDHHLLLLATRSKSAWPTSRSRLVRTTCNAMLLVAVSKVVRFRGAQLCRRM
jgi:phosphodiesterase/alkaline phosphatase D-like protein